MGRKEMLMKFYEDLKDSLSKLKVFLAAKAKLFFQNPLKSVLEFFAVIISVQFALYLIAATFGLNNFAFFPDDTLGIIAVIVVWTLAKANLTKVLIGLFLFLVYMFSIFFFIVPIHKVIEIIPKTIYSLDAQGEEGKLTLNTFQYIEDEVNYLSYSIPPDTNYYSYVRDGKILKDTAIRRYDDDMLAILDSVRKVKLAYSTLNKQKPEIDEFDRGMINTLELIRSFLQIGGIYVFTMLMGALGSCIAISRQYIIEFEKRNPSWYLYRLLQGMIMAVLVYYGLNAGMLSASADSEPIANSNNFEEIKYFIGFTSALSGLFSEQAFNKLNEVSNTLFGKAD